MTQATTPTSDGASELPNEPRTEPSETKSSEPEPSGPESREPREPSRSGGASQPVERVSVREAVGAWSRWLWAVGGVFAAFLLWWPTSYAGLSPFLTLPTLPTPAAATGVVLLGGLTSAATTAMLVRSPWPRFVIAVGFPVVVLLRSDPGARPVLALVAYGVLVLAGIALGAWATASVGRFAVVLALVVGLVPAPGFWWGPFLAVALALPFVRATTARVAPTVVGVVGVLVAWLVGVVLAAAVPRGFGSGSRRGVSLVTDGLVSTWDAVRSGGDEVVRSSLQDGRFWFAAAVVVAIVVVVVRAALGRSAARD